MNGYIQRAKRKKYLWELNQELFEELIFDNCFYCGISPSKVYNGRITLANKENILSERQKWKEEGWIKFNGVDRMNNSIGYTRNNSVSCCYNCNQAKLDRTMDEFMHWVERLVEHKNKRTRNTTVTIDA